jgi:DNA-binding transcriptional regulator YhcF (GntR family)
MEVQQLDLSGDGMIPIYMRIAQWLEDGILDGTLKADERIYSQYQLAEMFNINPATAAKGLSLLADEDMVYKKRGLGMFVSLSAKALIIEKRRGKAFLDRMRSLVKEARKLEIDEEKLVREIKDIYESEARA